jgi:hypothetical protein
MKKLYTNINRNGRARATMIKMIGIERMCMQQVRINIKCCMPEKEWFDEQEYYRNT